MSYYPPNVPAGGFTPGIHLVTLAEFKPIDKADTLAKLNAKVAFRATCKSVEDGAEIDLLIKFNGTRADYYAGLNIDLLFATAGLGEPVPGAPLDITGLMTSIGDTPFQIEVNDKGYVQSVLAPEPPTDEDAPF